MVPLSWKLHGAALYAQVETLSGDLTRQAEVFGKEREAWTAQEARLRQQRDVFMWVSALASILFLIAALWR